MPDEDTGVLFAMAQLPPGSTREQADKVLEEDGEPFPRRTRRT